MEDWNFVCVFACVFVCVWSSLCSPTASAAVINSGNIWCSVRLSECVFVYVAQFTSGLLLLFIVYRVFQGCALEGPCAVVFYGLNKKNPFSNKWSSTCDDTLCCEFKQAIRSMIKCVYRGGGSSTYIGVPFFTLWHIPSKDLTVSPLRGLPHYLDI